MQDRCSLEGDLTPTNDKINQIRRLREHLRRLAEEHNIVPMVIEKGNNQAINQWQLVKKDSW